MLYKLFTRPCTARGFQAHDSIFLEMLYKLFTRPCTSKEGSQALESVLLLMLCEIFTQPCMVPKSIQDLIEYEPNPGSVCYTVSTTSSILCDGSINMAQLCVSRRACLQIDRSKDG